MEEQKKVTVHVDHSEGAAKAIKQLGYKIISADIQDIWAEYTVERE